MVLSGEESQAYLLRYHLGKRAEEPRLEAPPVRPAGYVPVSYKVTKRETDHYALQVPDKAPGEDGVIGRMLAAAWDSVGPRVHHIYKSSLKLRHYPGEL